MTNIFNGVRVIELAQYVFVPSAGALMADHGAEVIKVEPPIVGDPYRTLKVGDGRESAIANLSMEQNNRGKKSVTIDLKTREGYEAMMKLIDTADVFLTSVRPKSLKALGLAPEDIRTRNPKVIYARGNGLGFKGEEADKPGYDASAFWARGGFASLLTAPDADGPVRSRGALGDHASALGLLAAISGALFRRERTGEAPLVETSLLQNAAWILSSDILIAMANPSHNPHAEYSKAVRMPLMKAYKTKDNRWIQLMLLAPDKPWPLLCDLLGMPDLTDDKRFIDNAARMRHGQELADIIAAQIGAETWDAWRPRFEAFDAPWELIRSVHEVAVDPQLKENGAIFPMTAETGATVSVVAGPFSFNGKCRSDDIMPSPALGDSTDALLSDIGYSAEQLHQMREKNII